MPVGGNNPDGEPWPAIGGDPSPRPSSTPTPKPKTPSKPFGGGSK